MIVNPRGPAGMALAAVLALVLASILPGCDRARPQVLLTRGTPEATPTSARLLPPSATPATPAATALAVTPLVVKPSATPAETRAATATATNQRSATPPAPEPTAPPTLAPTLTPTIAPTQAPASTPAAAATATPRVRIHIVRAGETLAIIARMYATTATVIARYNDLSNPNRIYVGQRLLIP